MEKRINVAELLKDCPKGMELDCTMYKSVILDEIKEDNPFPILIKSTQDGAFTCLNKYGCFTNDKSAKCVIFPKGKNSWKDFQRPFKDGDIVYASTDNGKYYTCIVDCIIGDILYTKVSNIGGILYEKDSISCYCTKPFLNTCVEQIDMDKLTTARLATEEEKQKLFDAIKANGYRWNSETKTLEKLVTPRFKVGDRVRLKLKPDYVYTIHSLAWDDNKQLAYLFLPNNDKHLILVSLNTQDNYELVPNKFDINTLVPFESRVLIRNSKTGKWRPAIWGFYAGEGDCYYVLGGTCWLYCIPYEGNKHLMGKTNDCDEYFKTWEK